MSADISKQEERWCKAIERIHIGSVELNRDPIGSFASELDLVIVPNAKTEKPELWEIDAWEDHKSYAEPELVFDSWEEVEQFYNWLKDYDFDDFEVSLKYLNMTPSFQKEQIHLKEKWYDI